jgi:hypothetical protein
MTRCMGVSSDDFPSSMGQGNIHGLMLPYLKNGNFLKPIKLVRFRKKLLSLVSFKAEKFLSQFRIIYLYYIILTTVADLPSFRQVAPCILLHCTVNSSHDIKSKLY